jgi:ABC-type nitrate/sulfonate/bicarbonate transport system permease component
MIVMSQTVPIIVIAPLMAMWFGFGILPKIFVVVLVCFFPVTISLIEGLQGVDQELIDLMRTMGASRLQIFMKIKIPFTMPNFFSGLKIAATYSIMGAVIGEWLGGEAGLGVFMLRARHAFALDKVFASIIVIVFLSVTLFYIIAALQRLTMPWAQSK